MRSKSIFFSLLLFPVFFSAQAFASPKTAEFEGSPTQVFNAAVVAAQKNWTVMQTDRQTMTLSFTTGTSLRTMGMDCSVVLQTLGPGSVRVTLRTQKKGQLFAWNVGASIAKKYFDAIQSELSRMRASEKAKPGTALGNPVTN